MMDRKHSLSAFLTLYFPTFIAAIFAAKISVILALFAIIDSFFVSVSMADEVKLFFICAVFCIWVLVHSNFMVIRGRPGWVWVFVGLFVACLLCVLPTIAYRPNPFVYAAGILFPLLGLLLINSQRHREMRAQLVLIRRKREFIQQALKKARKPRK